MGFSRHGYGCALAIFLGGLLTPVGANNLRVGNVELREQNPVAGTIEVRFDLSWDNSWRDDVNHDAAWVFLKFCAPGSNHWQHAYLALDPQAHTAPEGMVTVGTSMASGTQRGMGVFVYSSGMRTGSVHYARIALTWDYGASGYNWPSGGPEIELSVQAIEMVYVPQGAFKVGSPGSESGRFTDGAWVSGTTLPLTIESEAALTIAPQPGCLWGTATSGNNSIGPEGELPATFPKGYAAFYCMKYEITQGQYAAFLNLLTEAQAATLHPDQYGIQRFVITGSWPEFTAAEAPDRACNHISWPQGAAYAQWAGLRPMTELEFEKACRGPVEPVANEYAWGTTSIKNLTGFEGEDGSGTETPSPSDANALYGNSTLKGPARAGIFARPHSARAEAGASYWGIMELSGNLWERPVSVGFEASRLFEGTHGDGTLDAAGYATRTDWPGYANGRVIGNNSGAYRGGHWYRAGSLARTSDRTFAAFSGSLNFPEGWRGVRTAPQE